MVSKNWKELNDLNMAYHYRKADRWAGFVCVVAGLVWLLLPWGAA